MKNGLEFLLRVKRDNLRDWVGISGSLSQSSFLPWIFSYLPILVYLGYITVFGVDVIYWDEWNLFPMIHDFFSGSITFSDLWEQHNENRMVVPNFFFLLLAKWAHFDTKVGMFIGAFFLILSFFTIYYIFRKHFPTSRWAFVPISYLLFSLVQYENTLWGFQVAWYIILACLLGMCACLEQTGKFLWTFVIGVILAILASFSSFQGLFLWPAGFVYLLINNYSLRFKALWVGLFLLTTSIYFLGFDFHNTGGTSVFVFLFHPIRAVAYFFVVIGSVFPVGGVTEKGIIGVGLLVLALYSGIRGIAFVNSDRSFLLPLALMVFVVLFDASLVVGRSGFGVGQAISSRYSTYNILLLIAIYIVFIREVQKGLSGKKQGLFLAISIVVVLVVQVPASFVAGVKSGWNLYQGRTKSAETLRAFKTAPRNQVESLLWSNYQLVLERASWAERYHLSVFQKD